MRSRRRRASRAICWSGSRRPISSVTSVIVSSTAPVETIATRYGARILKVLRRGAVLEVNGGQLDALSRDADVDHLSGDVPVHRMSAETTGAIGADQVWRGVLSSSGRYTGAGIGVAVVDSGIAQVPSLNGRVVATVDFTGAQPKRADPYGHGTSVAGIIASTMRGIRVWRRARRW